MPATQSDLTLRNVQKKLSDVVDWYPLGVQLDVPTDKMRRFEIIHRGNPARCMLDMLEYWMHNSENVSWHYLAEALKTVGGYSKVVRSLLRGEERTESALEQSGKGMDKWYIKFYYF